MMKGTCCATNSTATPSGLASPRLCAALETSASPIRTSRPTNRALRTYLSSLCINRGARHERPRHRRHLPVRDGALEANALAEPDHSSDHHRPLFRGVRIGARQPHDHDGRDQLRRLHRAWLDAAERLHAVNLQRQLWHLFSEVYGNNLRTSISTNL